jgi:hypothetical protein
MENQMSPTLPKDPWGSISSTAISPLLTETYNRLQNQMGTSAASQIKIEPSKTISITVDQVSNGYIVRVRQHGTTIERVASDFENLGSEIMTALAEIQLGK